MLRRVDGLKRKVSFRIAIIQVKQQVKELEFDAKYKFRYMLNFETRPGLQQLLLHHPSIQKVIRSVSLWWT